MMRPLCTSTEWCAANPSSDADTILPPTTKVCSSRNPTPPSTALGRRPLSIHLNRLSSRAGPSERRGFSPSSRQRPPSSSELGDGTGLLRPNTGLGTAAVSTTATMSGKFATLHSRSSSNHPHLPSHFNASGTPGTSVTNFNLVPVNKVPSQNKLRSPTPSLMTFSFEESIAGPPCAFTSRPLTRQDSLTEALRVSMSGTTPQHRGTEEGSGPESTTSPTRHLSRHRPATHARTYSSTYAVARSPGQPLLGSRTSCGVEGDPDPASVTLDCDAVLLFSSPTALEECCSGATFFALSFQPELHEMESSPAGGLVPSRRGVPSASRLPCPLVCAAGRQTGDTEDGALCLSEWPSLMLEQSPAMEWVTGGAGKWEVL